MKAYNRCPACSCEKRQEVAQETNKGSTYTVSRCLECSVLYTSFQERDTNEDYHFATNPEEFHNKYAAALSNDQLHDRNINYDEEVKIISTFADSGNYLDVGCNAGWLLGHLKRKLKFNLFGVEPSTFLANLTTQRTNAKVYNSYLEKNLLPENYFDFISMTDVFEHIPNPNEILPIVHSALKPGKFLMIKVPNGKFTFFKYRFKNLFSWFLHPSDIFDAKEHLVHYDKKNLINILTKNNFRVVKFMTPRPVQTTGTPFKTRFARKIVYQLAQLGLPGQDLMVVGQKVQ